MGTEACPGGPWRTRAKAGRPCSIPLASSNAGPTSQEETRYKCWSGTSQHSSIFKRCSKHVEGSSTTVENSSHEAQAIALCTGTPSSYHQYHTQAPKHPPRAPQLAVHIQLSVQLMPASAQKNLGGPVSLGILKVPSPHCCVTSQQPHLGLAPRLPPAGRAARILLGFLRELLPIDSKVTCCPCICTHAAGFAGAVVTAVCAILRLSTGENSLSPFTQNSFLPLSEALQFPRLKSEDLQPPQRVTLD